jgi:hypothetical protein
VDLLGRVLLVDLRDLQLLLARLAQRLPVIPVVRVALQNNYGNFHTYSSSFITPFFT